MNAAAHQFTINDSQAPGWPRRHLIDVDQYYQMVQVGLLAPDARVELINGEIIDMAPIGNRHAGTVDHIADLLHGSVQGKAIVRVQNPVRLGNLSEPQPDIALLKFRTDYYTKSHATPADVLLIIEVSDSTLKFDLGDKATLYAQHGIPEYWVVDLENTKLHCYRQPHAEGYRSISAFTAPQVIQTQRLAEAQIPLAQLFD